jgi:hypothetical protein
MIDAIGKKSYGAFWVERLVGDRVTLIVATREGRKSRPSGATVSHSVVARHF